MFENENQEQQEESQYQKQLKEYLNLIIKWLGPHWQTIASVAGVVIVFSGLAIYFITHYKNIQRLTYEKLSIALGYAQHGMTDQSIQILDDIINKFSNQQIAQQARFIKANICFQTKNYNLAKSLYQDIINLKKPKILIPYAYSALGATKENLGDFKGAIETYQEFLNKFPEHYLAPRIYDSLARVYFVTGEREKAKEIYEKLITLYPGTYWSNQAQKLFGSTS